MIPRGETKAVITDAPEEPKSYFAISSIINGKPTMVHPLISSTEVTPGGYPHIQVVDETRCGEPHAHASVALEDPDFPLKNWTHTVSGVASPAESLAGSLAHGTLGGSRAEGKLLSYQITLESEEPLSARANPSSPGTASASAEGQLGYCQAAALGDSFSSGEGNQSFETGTGGDSGESNCHRSIDSAYLKDLAEKDGREDLGMDDFVACSGAQTADFETETVNNGQPHLKPQIETIPPDTNLVTFSIGGNDVGFKTILIGCIADQAAHIAGDVISKDPFQGFPPCEIAGAPYVASHLPALRTHLKRPTNPY